MEVVFVLIWTYVVFHMSESILSGYLSQVEPIYSFSTVLTFRHRTSSILDRRFAALQRTLFIYLINKYISLSDICLTVQHGYK